MKKIDLQTIMACAWQIKRVTTLMYGEGIVFGECLKMAWSQLYRVDLLKDKLTSGIVWFDFLKIDGSVRHACGTLCADYIPEQQQTESNRRRNGDVQVYFDIEKQEFRCFRKRNLLKIYA